MLFHLPLTWKVAAVAVLGLFMPLTAVGYYFRRLDQRREEVGRILDKLSLDPHLRESQDIKIKGAHFAMAVLFATVLSYLGLTALFLGHALVYSVALWIAAWGVARGLGVLPDSVRGACVAAAVAGALLWSVLDEPYVTPFGRAAQSNLVGVLR